MNKFIIFAAVFVVAVIVGYVFRIWNARRLSPEQLLNRLVPVDLECFHALLRSTEGQCLRELADHDARAVRRRFTLATIDYVDRVRRNSAVYAQLANRASHSSDAALAADARALARVAFQVRLNATVALAMMALYLPYPAARPFRLRWLGDYEAAGPRLAQLSAAFVPISGI